MTPSSGWFAVRCFFLHGPLDDEVRTYEERITIWRAATAEEAFDRAEVEAAEYVEAVTGAVVLATMQSYELADELGDGAEVYSLMRDSLLDPEAYTSRFFTTGDERHTIVAPDPSEPSSDVQAPFSGGSGS